MEQLIAAVEGYARQMGRPPEWVLRSAIGASWRQWGLWKTGRASPTVKNADRIYQYIAANPAPTDAAVETDAIEGATE